MQIKIKSLGQFLFHSNYTYDAHCHPAYEINFVLSGRCIMTVEGKRIALRQGDCIVLLAQAEHDFLVDVSEACRIMQLEFELTQGDAFLSGLPHLSGTEPCFKLSNCSEILECLRCLHRCAEEKQDGGYGAMLFELELKKLLVLLCMRIGREQRCEAAVLEPVLAYIDTHYEQPVDLEQLAKQNLVSPRYLRTLFLRYTGFSAIDYITTLRIGKAKDLLKNSSLSVSEIAARSGYGSVQYFSLMFRKQTGMPPRDFRKQYRL